MQRGCMQRNTRKEGPDVWQFRWSETRLDGKRLYHKRIVGTVEQYPDEDAARRSVVGLVSELNTDGRSTNSGTMTVAQLCDHFEQRELAKENTWRSHATKKIYKAYLIRWIRPYRSPDFPRAWQFSSMSLQALVTLSDAPIGSKLHCSCPPRDDAHALRSRRNKTSCCDVAGRDCPPTIPCSRPPLNFLCVAYDF